MAAALFLAAALLMLTVGPGCIDVARLVATPTPGPEAGVTIIVPVPATPPAIACTPPPPVCVTASLPPPTIVVPTCPPVTCVTATPCPPDPCVPIVP